MYTHLDEAAYQSVMQSTFDLVVLQPKSTELLPAHAPEPDVLRAATAVEIHVLSTTGSSMQDSGAAFCIGGKGFTSSPTPPHIDNTNVSPQQSMEFHRNNTWVDLSAGPLASYPCGAFEFQRGMTDDVQGNCSEFVVFSENMTAWFVAKGLDSEQHPLQQLSNVSIFVGHKTLVALVDAVVRAYAADYDDVLLVEGVDYRVFVVPGKGYHGYAIARGLVHAFYRGTDFTGAVFRIW
jgi:hypothetical protein